MGPEAKIQTAVVKYARSRYVGRLVARKNAAGRFGSNGYPDYEFNCEKRHTFFIEFKAPGGSLTALQEQRISELEDLGYTVYVIDKVDAGKLAIDEEMRPL
jgi:hypothetical protein